MQLHQQGTTTRNIEIVKSGDGTLKVRYDEQVDESQVRIDVVPPEEFGISPRAQSLDQAELVYIRKSQTLSDLRRQGFDAKLLDDLWADEKVWEDLDPEKVQRFSETDDASYLGLNDELTPAQKHVWLYVTYPRLDMDGSGIARLWEIVYAGNQILRKTPVARRPFVCFTPLRRPHAFFGSNFARRVQPMQNARTVLTRAILDHSVITTNPRWTVARGGLVNPKELLENRIGGIVNITRDGAVQPLEQPPLNPFVFQTLGMLDDEREQVTGVSKLSQGLNKDAISSQNSDDMVNRMVTMSMVRQKVIARNFAMFFLKELYLLVYQLVIENEKQQKVLQVAGDYVPVTPTEWETRKDVLVSFAVGYGEADKEAAKFTKIDQYLSSQPQLAGQYTARQRYHVLTQALEGLGVRDVASVLLPPEQAQPPQPDPVQVELAKVPLREVAVKEQHLQLTAAKMQMDNDHKRLADTLKATREGDSTNVEQGKLALEARKLEHQMTVDAAEIELQRKAQTTTSMPKPVL
jgi:hypothetical protein